MIIIVVIMILISPLRGTSLYTLPVVPDGPIMVDTVR